jgi:signal-transduction protein with cAMP-binding, CBS, and nucleotidyltransferase domain
MNREHTLVRVRDVMRTDFEIVDGMTTIADALRRMQETGTEALIIDRRHANDEYGLLLISDIARHVLGRDRAPDRVNAYEIMAKPVVSVDPDMDIRYCARLLERFDITRVPVLDNRQVVGMVGFKDLVLRGLIKQVESR